MQGIGIGLETFCINNVTMVFWHGQNSVLIINHLPWPAAKESKGFLVGCYELGRCKRMVLPKGIFIPGMRQDHGKTVNLDLAAVLTVQRGRPHIHLCLFSRRQFLYGLIAAERSAPWDGMLLTQPGNVTAHGAFRHNRLLPILFMKPVINLGTGKIRMFL